MWPQDFIPMHTWDQQYCFLQSIILNSFILWFEIEELASFIIAFLYWWFIDDWGNIVDVLCWDYLSPFADVFIIICIYLELFAGIC